MVCERWEKFENFLEDMGERPEGATLDRKNNDGNYEPGNCRWATGIEQSNNRGNNRRLTHNGKTQTCGQWARELGMNRVALHGRLKNGWTVAEALDTPIQYRCDKGIKKGARMDALDAITRC